MNSAFKPVFVLFAITIALVLFLAAPKLFEAKELVGWQSDLAAARKEAQTSAKPLLVYFTAQWCGPCQRMKHTVFADKNVEAAMKENLVAVKIDVDQNPKLASEMNVEVLPTFKLFSPQGELLREQFGGVDTATFLSWLNASNQPAGTGPATRR
jgi:thioredoxin-related protein